MRTLTLLNDRITHCTACPRLVTYRKEIAAEKRKQFEDWTYWGRPVPGGPFFVYLLRRHLRRALA